MKATLNVVLSLTSLALVAVPPLGAQDPEPYAEPAATELPKRTAEQLDELLGPIALYPDALVAVILPAATAPTDVVLAARYFENRGDLAEIDQQPWDDSVRALAHYPDIVKWMDQNLEWTKQVGEAFVAQPADVMKAVQRLRARAQANGALTTTPQQNVVTEGQVIRIVPAEPDVIYVPYYEPEVVYVERPIYYHEPLLTFGFGFPVGSWLLFDCDWHHRRIWVADWHRDWRGRRDWRQPVFPGGPGFVHDPDRRPWRPSPHSVRPTKPIDHRPRMDDAIVRPAPFIARSPSQPSSAPRADARVHPAAGTDREHGAAERTWTPGSESARRPVNPRTPSARVNPGAATPAAPEAVSTPESQPQAAPPPAVQAAQNPPPPNRVGNSRRATGENNTGARADPGASGSDTRNNTEIYRQRPRTVTAAPAPPVTSAPAASAPTPQPRRPAPVVRETSPGNASRDTRNNTQIYRQPASAQSRVAPSAPASRSASPPAVVAPRPVQPATPPSAPAAIVAPAPSQPAPAAQEQQPQPQPAPRSQRDDNRRLTGNRGRD